MKVLGMETSGKIASAAIVENGEILAEYTLNAGITHSQTFLPILDHMLKLSGMDLTEMEVLAVSEGPGSYTGLRIGIATAKGFALANAIPVVPVSTLKSLAQNVVDFNGQIFTLIFARAQELYYALYQAENQELEEIESPRVLLLPDVIAKMKSIQAQGLTIAVVGDGFFRFETEIRQELDNQKLFIPAPRRHQLSAAAIALLGEKKALAGQSISGSQLVPVYLKKTQAERECEQGHVSD
ncbi:tRNA (adenosine(37)-N6)-threonylcarbamoyltransferase complex dimerization subunit type 1 TsaB [Clostridiales bacterium COT073_COT-073]|nr:tRNA (adenosine(37)-N6)-threonylcarbamoyltransferase complex dimerization subunit type 1 TsaB [Clostridiales bacterium COT073_COT-073]